MICKKYILIIIILAVVFLPQCFVYASDTEITDKIEQQMLEKIDMSEIEKYSKDYLPDRLSFSDIVMPFWQEIKRPVKKSVSIFMSCFFMR